MDFSTIHGFFLNENLPYFIGGVVFLTLLFGYKGVPLVLWSLLILVSLVGFGAPVGVIVGAAVVLGIFVIKPIRAMLVSNLVMKIINALQFLPKISQTEKVALDAGVVWVEADLFSGNPDLKKVMNEPYPELTKEEKDFMSGPCDKLCGMINDWEFWQTRELPESVWQFIKENKFFGMIIPKEYGGLGFSALAHSEVIQKLATRSVPACVTVMVPNSLGPAELLIHYGTEEQKKKLLPRLALGQELPCFGLTEPQAGSDAGAIQADGVLFRGNDGKLYVRLNWNKRWITLAAISTIIGLAFKLRDPENLLGKGEDVGITCALVPSKTPGVVIGKRHDPLGVPFYNCPTQGKDVVIDVESAIVGGVGGIGLGWKMLMECLAAGRGVSLPAQCTGGAKSFTRIVTNHATIRKQFGLSIGKFEGIEEPIARIAGGTYMMEAMRKFTLGALDKGLKPPVITAIAKYHATEMQRKMVNDAMDILGGAGISNGPRNLLAHSYIATPIGITVEGANIMTRTLIIFGQGAMRAHPWAFKEIDSIEKNDVKAFDIAFWGHIGHIVRNTFRSFLLSITRGWLSTPQGGDLARYYRKLNWTSATFAIMADIAMGSLGGTLKAKEKITGRYADILSYMYIGSAVLRRYEAEGRRKEDLPFVDYSMKYLFTEIQRAFDGIFANLHVPIIGFLFKGPIRGWANFNSMGEDLSDSLSKKVTGLALADTEQRDRLSEGMYIPKDPTEALGRQEKAYKLAKKAEEAERKIRKAVKAKILPKKKAGNLVELAYEKGVINDEDKKVLIESVQAVWDAIQVDDFTQDEYLHRTPKKAESFKLVSGK
jgi:acyl-CoA dehydrogenase